MFDIQLIWWFVTQFWYIFPLIAVVMWFVIMSMARTIINRVLYIRKGGTMGFHKCVIQGTNIRFRASGKKVPASTVHIEAQPYTYVKGLSTTRVYVVTEGGGSTVTFPEHVQDLKSIIKKFLSENEEVVSIKKGKNIEKILKGWEGESEAFIKTLTFLKNVKTDEASSNPSPMIAAASASLFERTVADILEHLPKTKAQYLIIIIYVGLGVMVGLGWGALASKLGWI